MFIYSSRLENKVNNGTLENTKSFSLKITLATIVHCIPQFRCLTIGYLSQSQCYVNLDI